LRYLKSVNVMPLFAKKQKIKKSLTLAN